MLYWVKMGRDNTGSIMEKILIVDDTRNVRLSLQIGLERMGYSVDGAGSAKEALSKLENDQFDIVLTDVRMPEVNGFILGSVIKKLYPHTKLIFMSAYDFKDFNGKFGLFDNYHKLSKPFEMTKLVSVINNQNDINRVQV